MLYSDWSCTIRSLNSVELAVIDKHEDTNVNIGDFVIVKHKGKFYPGEVLCLVPNQSATLTQWNVVVWSFGNACKIRCSRLPIAWYWMSNQAPYHSIQPWHILSSWAGVCLSYDMRLTESVVNRPCSEYNIFTGETGLIHVPKIVWWQLLLMLLLPLFCSNFCTISEAYHKLLALGLILK